MFQACDREYSLITRHVDFTRAVTTREVFSLRPGLTYVCSFYAKRPKLTHYQGQPSTLEKKRKIEKFRVHKLSRIGQYRIFCVLKFREFGQNSQNLHKFLLAKVSAPKVTYHVRMTVQNKYFFPPSRTNII